MKFKNGIKERNIIVKCAADKLLAFTMVFGIYIILFGTISPGGGFQGGVIVTGGVFLLYFGYGHSVVSYRPFRETLRINESIGATIYVVLALLGIIFGANFARNVFFSMGEPGDLISAGTITFMGYAVGYKVLSGVGFLLLILLAFLGPYGDDDEGYGFDKEEDEE